MPMIELKVVPVRAELLSGESLDVEVTLKNGGDGAIDVRSPDEQSAFQYRLRPSGEGGGRDYLLSVEDWLIAQWGNPPKPMAYATETVKPAGTLTYKEEIAEYASAPILPGRYLLSVRYEYQGATFTSPETPIAIVVPHLLPRGLASAPGPSEGRLGLLLAHTRGDGSVALYQRESEAGNPASGVFYRRRDFAKGKGPSAIACAVELSENRGIRWFGWLEGSAMGAGLAQEASLFGTLGPVDLHLASADLYPLGWQPNVEEAIFLALGLGGDGGVTLASVTFAAGKEGTLHTATLDAAGQPARWAARYRPGEGSPRFDVVWAESSGDAVRLRRQTVQPGGAASEKPVLLAERPGPLVALGLDPIAGTRPGVVDALFGPEGEAARMTLLRLPLDGGSPVAEKTFAAPREAGGKLPRSWAIARQAVAQPLVVAWLGERLVARTVTTGTTWRTLTERAPDPDHLSLAVVGGNLWATWPDAKEGIQCRAIAGAEELGVAQETGEGGGDATVEEAE